MLSAYSYSNHTQEIPNTIDVGDHTYRLNGCLLDVWSFDFVRGDDTYSELSSIFPGLRKNFIKFSQPIDVERIIYKIITKHPEKSGTHSLCGFIRPDGVQMICNSHGSDREPYEYNFMDNINSKVHTVIFHRVGDDKITGYYLLKDRASALLFYIRDTPPFHTEATGGNKTKGESLSNYLRPAPFYSKPSKTDTISGNK